MSKKMTKDWYNNKLCEWFGFKGDIKPDFTKMTEVDLTLLYAKTELLNAISKDGDNKDSDQGGIFGFGILRGPISQRFNKEKREKLIEQVLSGLDADDLDKMKEKYGPLGKIATMLIGGILE